MRDANYKGRFYKMHSTIIKLNITRDYDTKPIDKPPNKALFKSVRGEHSRTIFHIIRYKLLQILLPFYYTLYNRN